MKKNVLVIGSGGREHAICKKLLESNQVENVYCAKGNQGMALDGIELVDINEDNHDALITFAQNNEIAWVIVGPEKPLINGIVDDFENAGIKAFGPKRSAAIIEGSKSFAKELMKKNNIPTANFKSFSDYEKALAYVKSSKFPVVIKADGLAAGKGVIIAKTLEEATKALKDILLDNYFSSDLPKVVIEEFLEGKEFSLLSFVNKNGFYPMVAAKDYKAISDGDKGLNTGGMGAFSPVDYVTEDVEKFVCDHIIKPTLDAMKKNGTPFEGILYTGLILTEDGPKVIEYNARFGDPETQVILERLDSDLYQTIEDLLNQKSPQIEWKTEGISMGIVIAAKGYPMDYEKNVKIPSFENEWDDTAIFYAGVKDSSNGLVSSGGRVFLVAQSAENKKAVQQNLYSWLKDQNLSHFYYRNDIGELY